MATRVRTKKWLNPQKIAEHGQYIFIYTSPKYNQIIYSLTRAMKSHGSLKQLPFLGKHTKPGTLRRDAWRPLATVSFPSGVQGLAAYKQLREFRKRHELEWTDEEMVEAARLLRKEREMSDTEDERKELDEAYYKDQMQRRLRARPTKSRGKPPKKQQPYWWNPTQLWTRSRRERAQVLMMTSKANSIADLAAVLGYQEQAAEASGKIVSERRAQNEVVIAKAKARIAEILSMRSELWEEGSEESLDRYKTLKREKMKLQKAIAKPDPYAALEGFYSWLNDPNPPTRIGPGRIRRLKDTPIITMKGIKIEWANPLDAQYASSWPQSVKHNLLPLDRHGNPAQKALTTRLKPPVAAILSVAAKGDGNYSADRQYVVERRPQVPDETPSTTSKPVPSRMERLLHRLKYGAT